MDDAETTYLNTREAAVQLGVPVREVYRLIDAGQLPAYKHGRDLQLRPADLDAYRAARSS